MTGKEVIEKHFAITLRHACLIRGPGCVFMQISATSLHCVQCVKAAVNYELSVQLRLVVYSAYELRSVLFQRRDIDRRSVVSFACE